MYKVSFFLLLLKYVVLNVIVIPLFTKPSLNGAERFLQICLRRTLSTKRPFPTRELNSDDERTRLYIEWFDSLFLWRHVVPQPIQFTIAASVESRRRGYERRQTWKRYAFPLFGWRPDVVPWLVTDTRHKFYTSSGSDFFYIKTLLFNSVTYPNHQRRNRIPLSPPRPRNTLPHISSCKSTWKRKWYASSIHSLIRPSIYPSCFRSRSSCRHACWGWCYLFPLIYFVYNAMLMDQTNTQREIWDSATWSGEETWKLNRNYTEYRIQNGFIVNQIKPLYYNMLLFPINVQRQIYFTNLYSRVTDTLCLYSRTTGILCTLAWGG